MASRPTLTWSLIAASVAVGLVSRLGSDPAVLTWLTLADLRSFDGSVAGGFAALARGEIWRLATPILVHFGLLHLAFNMLWLNDLGSLIELRWSRRTLTALVAVSAVVPNVAQFLVNWDARAGLTTANALAGGMSGVVYALFGYVWQRGRTDPAVRLPASTVALLLGWLVAGFTGMLGPIGNTAHLAGAAIGIAWGALAAHRR